MTAVSGGSVTASFVYDADGNRVKGTVNGTTTVYIAGLYEYQGGATTLYYEGNALRRTGYAANNGVFYFLQDQLKSSSTLANQNGTVNSRNYFYPFGGNRGGAAFSALTTKRFTGQYQEQGLPGGEGLSYYGARWYDAQLGRFASPDTIVPGAGNPQTLNRYSYVFNNPLRFIDPSGHYGDDVHHDRTLDWAGKAIEQINTRMGRSLDVHLAERIANADVGTDRNFWTRPDNPMWVFFARDIQDFCESRVTMSSTEYYHFMPRTTTENRLRYAVGQGDVEMFGRALHGYQDTFPHIESGWSFHAGQAGINELRGKCTSCYNGNPLQAAVMDFKAYWNVGHVPMSTAKDFYAPAFGYTDGYDATSARDTSMRNGTQYWATLFLLGQAGISANDYYYQTYGMPANFWYGKNVLGADVPCTTRGGCRQ